MIHCVVVIIKYPHPLLHCCAVCLLRHTTALFVFEAAYIAVPICVLTPPSDCMHVATTVLHM